MKGFSLVEITVAVIIIALLSVSSVLGFAKHRATARETKRLADISNLGIAIESFRATNSRYPYQDSDTNLNNDPSDGTDIASAPEIKSLVNQGFISVLPQEPKPITGGSGPFCSNYTYAADWDNHNNNRMNGVLAIPRQYVLSFRSELPAQISGVHPLESSIMSVTNSACGSDNVGYAVFFGPAK